MKLWYLAQWEKPPGLDVDGHHQGAWSIAQLTSASYSNEMTLYNMKHTCNQQNNARLPKEVKKKTRANFVYVYDWNRLIGPDFFFQINTVYDFLHYVLDAEVHS